jgi:hypothetical protein
MNSLPQARRGESIEEREAYNCGDERVPRRKRFSSAARS